MIRSSICIPKYNRANHLINCLESLIQSGVGDINNVEICFCDNHSTDLTSSIIDEVQKYLR